MRRNTIPLRFRWLAIYMGLLSFLAVTINLHTTYLTGSSLTGKPSPPPKSELYLNSSLLSEYMRDNQNSLNEIFEDRYQQYRNQLSDLNANIGITVTLCVVSAMLIFRKEDFTIPLLSSIQVPVSVAYLVIPGTLTYLWLKFGFILHHTIETRIALTNIVEAQQALIAADSRYVNFFKSEPESKIFYSLTRAVNLRDQGFIDCWFMFFLESKFISAKLIGADKLVPQAVMICIGLLQGIAHGFSLSLPLNWIRRWRSKKLWPLAAGLFFVNTFLIASSHWSFYFSGRNPNWLSVMIMYSGLTLFIIITHNKVCDSYLRSGAKQTKTAQSKASPTTSDTAIKTP